MPRDADRMQPRSPRGRCSGGSAPPTRAGRAQHPPALGRTNISNSATRSTITRLMACCNQPGARLSEPSSAARGCASAWSQYGSPGRFACPDEILVE